jgi:hypothetical protein
MIQAGTIKIGSGHTLSARDQIERRTLPLWLGKPAILRLRLDQGPRLIGRQAMKRQLEQFIRAPQRILSNRQLPLRHRAARCAAQSILASDNAIGDMPPVKPATVA